MEDSRPEHDPLESAGSVHVITARLRAVAVERGSSCSCSLASAARRLGLAPRTLQRRLKVEGTNYRRVMDEVRLSLALQLLSSPLSIGEAAQHLGFSEPSPFFRAFRRWAGATPGRSRLPSAIAK